MADYATILVGTDLSDPSLAAVREAGRLAGRLSARLIVSYVMENRLPKFLSDAEVAEIQARHRQHAEASLQACIARELPGQGAEPLVLEGEPDEAIVRAAGEQGAELIVIGMQGHGVMRHSLFGSTAERVLHHATCPVLVVPHAAST